MRMRRHYWLWAGAAFALLSCLMQGTAHELFPAPLLQSADLSATEKALGYTSWHILTLVFAASAVGYALAAARPAHRLAALYIASLNASLAAMVLLIAVSGHPVMLTLPSIYVFAGVAAPGFIGSLGGSQA